jgi:hypothetical protein
MIAIRSGGYAAMALIFLSYRREDTKAITGRISDRLKTRFGKSSIFLDTEMIPAGFDFRTYIETVLADCKVMLVIIGPQWRGVRTLGGPRIFEDGDLVRIEIEIALKRNIPIIPVLIDRAPMLEAEQLPVSIQPLIFFESAPLDSGGDFDDHSKRLIRAIEQHLKWRDGLPKYWWAAIVAAVVPVLALGAANMWRELSTTSSRPDSVAAIRACGAKFEPSCAQQGGAFGSNEALAGLRSCKGSQVVASDEPSLRWKDVWTTSVYSYAPGGGGPGGGLDNDELKVGGWGDWYFSLIQFDLPALQRRPTFAAIALYSKRDEAASVPLALDRVIQRWDFPKGDRLWWKDKPGARAISAEPLPAPRQEQWYVIELTNFVQEWFDGKSANFGIQIRPNSNYGSVVVFVSSDASDKSKIPRLIFCE